MKRFFRRLKLLRRRAALDRELAEEIEFHRAMKEQENGGQGLSPEASRQAAQRQMGNLTQAKESSRDMWSFPFLEQLMQDTSVALRSLRRDRVFTATAILSLALGIGANTAIFTALNAVLLRPLPYSQPQQLFEALQPILIPDAPSSMILAPQFEAWRNDSKVFDQLAAWTSEDADFVAGGSPERITTASVTANFLPTLGILPGLGRNFSRGEDQPNGTPAVILAHSFWRRHFPSGKSALGQHVKLNGRAYTVVGILPISFRFPAAIQPEALLPAQLPSKPSWGTPRLSGVRVVGRLRTGITAERAAADLGTITKRQEPDMPAYLHHLFRRNIGPLHITSLQTHLVGDIRWTLFLLLAGVILLLAIACANVANLQFSRACARYGELALRAALGAGRRRLMRFLLTESLLIAVVGGVCGLALAWGLVRLLGATTLLHLTATAPLSIQGVPLLFTLAISVFVALVCGLFPALFASKPVLYSAIKGASAQLTGVHTRFRSAFVVGEVALTLILSVGALLLLRSLQQVLQVNPGFQPEHVLTMETNIPNFRHRQPAEMAATMQSELQRIAALPGILSVGASSSLLLTPFNNYAAIQIEGQPILPNGQRPSAATLAITPDYFKTLRVLLLAGRSFLPTDSAHSLSVAIVNVSFARRFFGSADPVGKRLQHGVLSGHWTTIVGVVTDAHHDGRETDPIPELYVPYTQNTGFIYRPIGIAIRTTLPAARVVPAVRQQITRVDPAQPIFDIATMEHRLSESTGSRRMQTALISSFALIALCLAAIGVYGVLSYSVSQSTREIGIRMALGAQKGIVLRTIIRRGIILAAGGVAIGLAISFATVRYLASFLYHVKPLDWISFTAGTLLILLLAILASYIPARRAANVDPMTALRYE